jgi:tRNA U38,U39,U40 pseudouridine synthase TruA
MYYPPAFLETTWAAYKAQTGARHDEEVDPDAFAVWGFEQLLRSRQPRYAAIAKQYGYTIRMDDLAQVADNAAFLDLVADTIDAQIDPAR